MSGPRITFGMIVLNGEPFLRYNLRALYPFAHQIIVVEGACPAAKGIATENGHSQDATLRELRHFQEEEDPEDKLTIVTAEEEGRPNGFWPEKDEMSRAYAAKATGNYLWQVDCDEFYLPEDMRAVVDMLAKDPDITAVSFPMLTFWGGIDYLVDGFFLRQFDVHRLFAWGKGYRYSTHRPPTVLDDKGKNLREIKPISAMEMARRGRYMFHYELLYPKQVMEKCEYYAGAQWLGGAYGELKSWMKSSYLSIERPFRPHMVFKHVSWLRRFDGAHPPQVAEMARAVSLGEFPDVELRGTKDVENLLDRPSYRAMRAFLLAAVPLDKAATMAKNSLRKVLGGSWFWRRLQSLRAGVEVRPASIAPGMVTRSLTDGWKSPRIPGAQRTLTKQELGEMYNGNVIRPWAALAEAVRFTRCEHGCIVEVGCSTGYHYEVLKHLLNREVNYLGVDYSESMIEEASRLYPFVPFKVGDATALPLEDRFCDVLISGCVILHVPGYDTAIIESARVSRRWVILHKTPLVQGETSFYTKRAYGIPCVEIHFNEQELLKLCRSSGLTLRHELEIQSGDDRQKTYVFEKNGLFEKIRCQ